MKWDRQYPREKKKFRIVIVKMIHDLRKVLEAKIEKMKGLPRT